MNPPDNLPPLSRQREILTWAFDQFGPDGDFDKAADKRMFNSLESWLMELEAVREPAEEEPPFPGAKSDSIEGLANLDHFVSKAFTKSFTVGGSEPANELAAGEALRCKTCGDTGSVPAMVETATGYSACPYIGEACPDCPQDEPTGIERELARNGVMLVDCNLSEPTGVEARVCEDGWRPIEGKVNGIIFAVSNDGGKTGVAWRDDVHEALAYRDMQGGDYAVVAVRRTPPAERSGHE